MSTFSDTSPILIKKRKGDSTEPFKPIIENLRIIDNIAILNEIPDKFRRVNIQGMFEKRTDCYDGNNNIAENEYIIDYKLGYVFFNEKMNDKTVKTEYLGTGVVLYPASRIYDTGRKDVIVTIQEMIDGGRRAIEAYGSIDKAIEVAKDYYVKISTANEEAKQTNETLNITIVNGKDINEILKNSIKKATDINNTLSDTIVDGTNKIVEMDNKIKEVNEISTKASSTIETAKQTDETLNKTILNGKNTDNILNESIKKSTDIHNILNGSVIEGTNKITEVDNKAKEINLNEENRVTEENKRVDAEKIRVSNELSRQQGYSNMEDTIDNFSICEEYVPEKQYKRFNRVTLNGSSYECIKDCQGILPTDINNWICIAKKGRDGIGNMNTEDYDKDGDGIIDLAKTANNVDWNNVQNKPNFSEFEKIKSVNAKTPNEIGEIILSGDDIKTTDGITIERNINNIKIDIQNKSNEIGDISTLKTINKNNTVEAINEIKNNLNDNYYNKSEIDKKLNTQFSNIRFYKGSVEPSVNNNENCVWLDTKEKVIKLKENNIWITFGAVYL